MLVSDIRGISKGYLGEGTWELKGLKRITVLFGKNGSGKSTILEWLGANLGDVAPDASNITVIRNRSDRRRVHTEKIVPERGGLNRPEGSYLNNLLDSPTWFEQQMRGNVQPNYRQLVASKFQNYIMKFASVRRYGSPYRRAQEMREYLNKLLPPKHEVFILEGESRFQVRKRGEAHPIPPENLSSGEREALSLGIDILVTVFQAEAERQHLVLLLDEPDVHLHPDLQHRLFVMLNELVGRSHYMQVIIATHSPAFLSDAEDVGVIWVDEALDELRPRTIPSWFNPLLLTLGKGVLSPILSNIRTLLVEGPDDYLVWHQAVRSSGGTLKLVVIDCGSKSEIDKYIGEINRLLGSLSEPGEAPNKVVALKDSDGGRTSASQSQFVQVFWTQCHELENCIFSDQVSSEEFRQACAVGDFMHEDIKGRLETLVTSLPPSERTWQQRIGAEIGKAFHGGEVSQLADSPNSIVNYLGKDFLEALQA